MVIFLSLIVHIIARSAAGRISISHLQSRLYYIRKSRYRTFFMMSLTGFFTLLHQCDVEAVTDFDPPAGGGLDFHFQRVREVLHLGFHQLLDVIQVDGT